VPNLQNETNYEALNKLINDFESLEHSIGSEGTMIWMRDYLDYLSGQKGLTEAAFLMDMSDYYTYEDPNDKTGEASQAVDTIDLSKFNEFIQMPQYRHWRESVHWHTE
jgi:hypothetical protein